MKKIIIPAIALLLISGVTNAQDKQKQAAKPAAASTAKAAAAPNKNVSEVAKVATAKPKASTPATEKKSAAAIQRKHKSTEKKPANK